MTAVIILAVLVVLAAIYLFLSAPTWKNKGMEAWKDVIFAHRGLHGKGVCENTLNAFDKACKKGYGIELDVQLSKDGQTVVFHDDTLARLCQDPRRVDELTYEELQQLTLPDGSKIPTFAQVLEVVNGRTPLLVELKDTRSNNELCEKSLKQLREYKGRYLVESFSPTIMGWVRKNAPDILRGQLVGSPAAYKGQSKGLMPWLLTGLFFNFISRPHFVAYDVTYDKLPTLIQRKIYRAYMACWTVKDSKVFDKVAAKGVLPIFEQFLP